MSNHQLQEQIKVQREEDSYDFFEENGDIQLDKREEVEENIKQEKIEGESSSDEDDENLSDILSEDYNSNDQFIYQLNNPRLQNIYNQNMTGPQTDNFSIDYSNHHKFPLRRLVSSIDKLEMNSQNSLNHDHMENEDISLGEQIDRSENYQYNRNRSLMNLIQSADGQIISQNNLNNSDQPRIIQIIGEKYEKGKRFYKVLWSDRKISIEDVSVANDYKQLKDEYELQVQQFLDMSHINRIDSREKISIFARRKRKVCVEQKKKKISDLNKQKYRIKKLIQEGNLTPEDIQKIQEERKMRRKKIERRKNKELLDIKAEQSDAVIADQAQKSYITRRRMSSVHDNLQTKGQSTSQQIQKENNTSQQNDDQQINENAQKDHELESNQNGQVQEQVEKIEEEEENNEIESEQNELNQSQSQEEYAPSKRRSRAKRNSKNKFRKQIKKNLSIQKKEKVDQQIDLQAQVETETINQKLDENLNQTNHQDKQDLEQKLDEKIIQDAAISLNQNGQLIPENSEIQVDQLNNPESSQIEQKDIKTEQLITNNIFEIQKNQQSLKKNGQPRKIQWKKLAKIMKLQNLNQLPNQIANQIVEGSFNNQENEKQINKDQLNLQTENISQDINNQVNPVKSELNEKEVDLIRSDQQINFMNHSQSLKKNGQPRKIQWKKLAKMKKEMNRNSENNLENQNAQSGEPSQVGKTRRKTLKPSQEIKTNKQILNQVDEVPKLRQKYQKLRVRKANLRITKNFKRKQKVYNLRSQNKK
ncbi:hypothetical protein ABPG74_007776 [Tetrahymena malaccensis]